MDHENVRPDIVILGKALCGGVYPVSVMLITCFVTKFCCCCVLPITHLFVTEGLSFLKHQECHRPSRSSDFLKGQSFIQYIKHEEEYFIRFPNTENWVE